MGNWWMSRYAEDGRSELVRGKLAPVFVQRSGPKGRVQTTELGMLMTSAQAERHPPSATPTPLV